MIHHNKPTFNHEEINTTIEIIKSGMITQGEKVKELENRLASSIGKRYCSAVSSGTMALSLALKALNVKQNDEVIIPSYTCSALYHAVKFNDAKVVYADIEEKTSNLSPDSVKLKITPKTKAIIFPHSFGQPGYIQEIKKFGIPVIEDIAQSVGAKIDDKNTGYFGDLTVMSFYATKMLGAGEGGAVLTDFPEIYSKINNLREYDELNDLSQHYNAKMTNITAGIALAQLDKLEDFILRRNEIFNRISNKIVQKIEVPYINSSLFPNFYRLIIKVDEVSNFINSGIKSGVQFRRPVFKPLHLYKNIEKLPVTEKKWAEQVSVPIYPKLTEKEIEKIIKVCTKLN